jgi:hypothetical protein
VRQKVARVQVATGGKKEKRSTGAVWDAKPSAIFEVTI